MAHFHGDGDDVHGRTVHELLVIVERHRHTEELAGSVGRFASRGRQRRDLEIIRERRQRRNVRLRRPAAVRIGADDADPNPLCSMRRAHRLAAPFGLGSVLDKLASASILTRGCCVRKYRTRTYPTALIARSSLPDGTPLPAGALL